TLFGFLNDSTFKAWEAVTGREAPAGVRPGLLSRSTLFTADGQALICPPALENRLRCGSLGEARASHDGPIQLAAINDAALSPD
ncbi:hypothetical protein, partial [Streptomyces turgidiscabies]|uniref:hypothetical protein n=1 Tax=Streptomyces turgidiscabies TaxID=85558 RepID=UPI0038F676E1